MTNLNRIKGTGFNLYNLRRISEEEISKVEAKVRGTSNEQIERIESKVIWNIGTGADCMQDGERQGKTARLESTLPYWFKMWEGIPMWETRAAVDRLINEGYLVRIPTSNKNNAWGETLIELTDKGVEARDRIISALSSSRDRSHLSIRESLHEVDEIAYNAFRSVKARN